MGDDYTTIPIHGFPSLTEVRLYDETVEYIAEHHREFRMELPSQRTALVDAIGNPISIHISTTDPEKSVVIVSDSFTYRGDPVVVPVRRVQGTSGRVVTAYFSGDTYPGGLMWSSSSG